jgi:hypothetical protein
MGTRRAALHLDLFEQPGQKRVFQHPVRTSIGQVVDWSIRQNEAARKSEDRIE